eukprot:PLAT5098.1.p2 GENE.PLAT5098.1~~PLAT5098.1.p2  ORF type:complete len:115 (+),score=25.10 PLAT5098.1:145-489(+)
MVDAAEDELDALFAELDAGMRFSREVMAVADAPKVEAVDWDAVQVRALVRDEQDCPICMCAFGCGKREKVLLSCTHVFHTRCLSAFEDFNLTGALVCPVCRSSYQKMVVDAGDL